MAKAIQKPPVKRNIWWKANARHKTIFIWILEIIAVLILSAIVAHLFFRGVTVQENSMSPTIQAGNHVKINRMSYFLGSPDRGDVIAFYKDSDMDESIQIKRIIGIPGDMVQIIDGMIVLNGKTYMEDKHFAQINHPGLADHAIKLGSEEYFVLGDNRNNSEDSRFADMGNVLEENIIGKAWFITSPFSGLGFVD